MEDIDKIPEPIPPFPYTHVDGAYPPSVSDDSGPDCPYCGPVQWPCGDHFHNGVRWIGDTPTRTEWEGAGLWEETEHVTVECPKCHRKWRHDYA